MSSRTLCITLLASEWKSSKGGLSTMNRELAIQLAKHPNVSVSFLVPKCSLEDSRVANSYHVNIVEAKKRPGYEPVEWLAFPPKDLEIDFVVGHGVVLGKPAQIIRDSHHCKWTQVVHTAAPDELAMYKTYSDAIPKGDKKQEAELQLCEIADLVIAVGPKVTESYSALLSSSGKKAYNFTPGIFTEFSSVKLPFQSGKKFRLLLFGRGDIEDFELKGYDIAAQAIAKLNDKSYNLTFVGASSGSETQVAGKLLKHGLARNQLIVKGYLEDGEYVKKLLCASNLVIIPSRTEGFGLIALEALSAGLPFLVSQNSGFGEALQEISFGSNFIVDSEDPEEWAKAIKHVRQKGSEIAIKECQELRARYAEKYSWKTQCDKLVKVMLSMVNDQPSSDPLDNSAVQQTERDTSSVPARKTTTHCLQGARPKKRLSLRRETASVPRRKTTTHYPQRPRPKKRSPLSSETASSSTEANKSTVPHASGLQLEASQACEHQPQRLLPIEHSRGYLPASMNAGERSSEEGAKEENLKCFRLFNCDKTYELDTVKNLLLSIEAELSFAISIQQHYFDLMNMSEVRDRIIKKELEMDFAIFVVHAHESRLSINEENVGIGYAKLYKALLQATDERVLIVIGGDDNYKDFAEEQSMVLSRWARRKVSYQFNEEFLDGRKSFIFSWDKKHRPIHEEATLHSFDPDKKGKKFVPKPKDLRKVKMEEPALYREQDSVNESQNAAVEVSTAGSHLNYPEGTVLLDTRLRYGELSYEVYDLKKKEKNWYPPQEMRQRLQRKYKSIPEAQVKLEVRQNAVVQTVNVIRYSWWRFWTWPCNV